MKQTRPALEMRSRRVRAAALFAAIPALLLPASGSRAAEAPAKAQAPLYRSALLVDLDDGRVLSAENETQPWPPASMLKMLTLLVALERVREGRVSLDDEVTVSALASSMGGSQMYLAPGERLSLRELLRATLIHSANDAAVAVAEHVGGSVPAFVEQMNAKAQELGLQETRIHSVHGLPPAKDQPLDEMSARDLARLGRALFAFPEIVEWAGIRQAPFGDGRREMYNPNHLLRTYRGATGLKTGFIRLSGFGVTATAERDGLRLLVVVTGAETKKACFGEAARLLDWGFASYRAIDPVRGGETVGPTIAVSNGAESFFRGQAAKGVHLVLPRLEASGVDAEVRVPAQVTAPVQQGQVVGEVVVRRGSQELARTDVLAPHGIERVGWLARWW